MGKFISTRALILVITLILSANVSFADTGDAGQAGEFLRYGVGARALGMGRAFTAVADDASAIYWNPAGLAQFYAGGWEATTMYSNLFWDTTYFYVGAARCFLFGTVGLGFVSLNTWGFHGRDQYNQKTGIFSTRDMGILCSLGNKFGKLHSGVTLKVNCQSIQGSTDWCFGGVDIGWIYRHSRSINDALSYDPGILRLSLLSENLGGKIGPDKIKPNIKVGGSYRHKIPQKHSDLLLAVDLQLLEKRGSQWSCGLEYIYDNVFFIRVGINSNECTGGLGFYVKGMQVDYAYTYNRNFNLAELRHGEVRISLTYKFVPLLGPKEPEVEEPDWSK